MIIEIKDRDIARSVINAIEEKIKCWKEYKHTISIKHGVLKGEDKIKAIDKAQLMIEDLTEIVNKLEEQINGPKHSD